MKWYWILFWIVIASLIIYGIIIIKKSNEYKKSQSDPRVVVQSLIDLAKKSNESKPGSFDFEKIKQLAKNQGVIVVDSNETRTMEFNPRRVVVKQTYPQCIQAPCPIFLSIQSVG